MNRRRYRIRDARPGDINVLAGLLGQLFAIETDFTADPVKQRDGLAMLLADRERSTVQVAEFNGAVAGFCTAQLSVSTAAGGYSARVEDLIVDARYRRRGIGTGLLEAVERWALEHGSLRLQLLADSRNGYALDFYRRKGWLLSRMVCMSRETEQERDAGAGGIRQEEAVNAT